MSFFGLNVLARQAIRIRLMVSGLGCLYEDIGLNQNAVIVHRKYLVLEFGSFYVIVR